MSLARLWSGQGRRPGAEKVAQCRSNELSQMVPEQTGVYADNDVDTGDDQCTVTIYFKA